jgi:hypothetical protein
MSGGYATDISDIVTIHANTIRVAVDCLVNGRAIASEARPTVSEAR